MLCNLNKIKHKKLLDSSITMLQPSFVSQLAILFWVIWHLLSKFVLIDFQMCPFFRGILETLKLTTAPAKYQNGRQKPMKASEMRSTISPTTFRVLKPKRKIPRISYSNVYFAPLFTLFLATFASNFPANSYSIHFPINTSTHGSDFFVCLWLINIKLLFINAIKWAQ